MNNDTSHPNTPAQKEYDIALNNKKSFLGTLKRFFIQSFSHSESVTRESFAELQVRIEQLTAKVDQNQSKIGRNDSITNFERAIKDNIFSLKKVGSKFSNLYTQIINSNKFMKLNDEYWIAKSEGVQRNYIDVRSSN